MTKKHHQSDKLYISTTEHRNLFGGKKLNSTSKTLNPTHYKIIPFTHCCISFQEARNPYADAQGHIYDLVNVLPFLRKFKSNPVTGEPMTTKDLFKVNIHKNENKKIHCPATFKILNEKLPVVVNRKSGNVYSKEAVDNFNLKLKSLYDLVDNSPFTPSDIISLNDPADPNKFNISQFHHVKNKLSIRPHDSNQNSNVNLSQSSEFRMTMEQLKAKSLPPVPQSAVVSQRAEKSKIRVAKNDKTLSNSSSGLVAFSLTSTAVDLHVTAEHAYVSDLEMLYNHVDQNAFVTIETNMGKLNCELFCKQRPRTCHNFIGLSLKGHYDRSLFFKLEKDFLIQGGDPSGTGRFNDSLWGEKFKDEFRPFISFNSTGCLGMANYGEKHTNGSQFFITMQALPQLDNKYTIFGRVVGGLDVLKQMNHVDVDPSMRPIKEIIISRVLCINDPFRVAQELIDSSTSKPDDAVERCADLPQKDLKEEKQLQTTTYNASKRIGKYLKNNTNSGQQDANQVDEKNQSNAGSSKPNVSSFDDW